MSWKTPIIQLFWKMIAKSDAKIVHIPPEKEITKLLNIPYVADGTEDHLLDIYYPAGTSEKLPTIINIHGGGLMYGNKELNTNYNLYIASYGFAVVSINYRLAPSVTYVEQIKDVLTAFAWVKEHAGEYPQLDLERLFVTGDSAGGFLALHATATNNSPTLCQFYGATSPELDIKALGLNFGMIKMHAGALPWGIADSTIGKDYKTKPYLKLEDINTVATLPPVWMMSSEEDFVRTSSEYTAKFLQSIGADYEYKFYSKTKEHPLPHVFNVQHPTYQESVDAHDSMVTFFRKRIGE